MARTKRLNLCLSKVEFEVLKKTAEKQEISMGELMRDLIKKELMNKE